MNNDHTPITRAELDIRRISGTNGERIPARVVPNRPEYGAPIPVSALLQDRHTRGRKLTREEYDAEIDDHRAAIDRGQSSLMAEIAAQLREEVRELELVRTGSFAERLEALGVELAGSDDPLQSLAGKFVEIALLHLRGASPTASPTPGITEERLAAALIELDPAPEGGYGYIGQPGRNLAAAILSSLADQPVAPPGGEL